MIREIKPEDFSVVNKLGAILNETFDVQKRGKLENIIVYEKDGEVAGFVQFMKLYEVVEIINIVVSEATRRMGIGRALIEHISNLEGTERIILEVRESNYTGIEFYKKLGFKNLRKINNYYKNGECAYAMEKVI